MTATSSLCPLVWLFLTVLPTLQQSIVQAGCALASRGDPPTTMEHMAMSEHDLPFVFRVRHLNSQGKLPCASQIVGGKSSNKKTWASISLRSEEVSYDQCEILEIFRQNWTLEEKTALEDGSGMFQLGDAIVTMMQSHAAFNGVQNCQGLGLDTEFQNGTDEEGFLIHLHAGRTCSCEDEALVYGNSSAPFLKENPFVRETCTHNTAFWSDLSEEDQEALRSLNDNNDMQQDEEVAANSNEATTETGGGNADVDDASISGSSRRRSAAMGVVSLPVLFSLFSWSNFLQLGSAT